MDVGCVGSMLAFLRVPSLSLQLRVLDPLPYWVPDDLWRGLRHRRFGKKYHATDERAEAGDRRGLSDKTSANAV
ncbi:hypothetical protein PSP31121_02696 [Pandoraea sputorum]|uniref:Uncharacterized protein n=1 Tax=Pandoraea sputorum TaxID=93222 RepID=A0A5E5B547_9BURK|nr:hypothetical protein PSP31121_02696 [Pandoraea sputorum]